jgi:hypothetical protein
MKKPKKTAETVYQEVTEIHMREARFNLRGASPLIMHRFSQKAWRELLYPSPRENQAALEQTLKHDPMDEYRGAFYRNRDDETPTLFHLPNGCFHGAIAQAAIDIPGAAKAQIERLTRVVDVQINLYGTPQIFCAMVRNSGITRTPDVRTRPIFPQWACTIVVRYVGSILTEKTIAALVGAAGKIVGIGDWRGEKGGPYGSWELVDDKDERFRSISKQQNRKAQQLAFDSPAFFDTDTEELLTWFSQEVERREMNGLLKTGRKLEPAKGLRTILERGGGKNDEAGDYLGVEKELA